MNLLDCMAALHVSGASVTFIDPTGVHPQVYGTRDGEHPVTVSTLFQAASVSKPVAAMAALALVQAGHLDLDVDVARYLRGWHLNAPATLRALLSHTAGVNVHGFGGYAPGAKVPTLAQVLKGESPARSAPIRVEHPPGRQRYSGGGYEVVQAVVEAITGVPFAEAVRVLVLGPLAMHHSNYQQPLRQTGNVAVGHRANGDVLPGGYGTYPELAAAGLWTTACDLAMVVCEVQEALAGRGRVLSQAVAQQMLTPVPGAGGFGLGFMLHGSGPSLQFSHAGVNHGYRSHLVGAAYTAQGAVVLTNGDAGAGVIREIDTTVSAF